MKVSSLNQELSVLGFGAGAVMGRVGKRDSLQALHAALDAGINVFDTARSYGYGESEALLGTFFQGRRDDVIISTKFGIVPAKQSLWKAAAKPLGRAIVRAVPGIAKSLRARAASEFQPGQFTVAILQESICTSLRKLRTDYVDILFMHGATMETIHNEDLLRALENLLKDGKVRVIGVSADAEIALAALKLPNVKAIQFACHVGNGFAERLSGPGGGSSALRFANHPFGGPHGSSALQALLSDAKNLNSLPKTLCDKLCSGDRRSICAEIVLNSALAGNDVVLATMMRPSDLRTNAAAVCKSRFSAYELLLLRDWLCSKSEVRV